MVYNFWFLVMLVVLLLETKSHQKAAFTDQIGSGAVEAADLLFSQLKPILPTLA